LLQHIDTNSLGVELKQSPEFDRISSHMDGGNKLREAGSEDVLALHAIHEISRHRPGGDQPYPSSPYMQTGNS